MTRNNRESITFFVAVQLHALASMFLFFLSFFFLVCLFDLGLFVLAVLWLEGYFVCVCVCVLCAGGRGGKVVCGLKKKNVTKQGYL